MKSLVALILKNRFDSPSQYFKKLKSPKSPILFLYNMVTLTEGVNSKTF
jgi:hypothetical protein